MMADVLIRYALKLDLIDVGADLALATVTAFLTLLIENLRQFPSASSPSTNQYSADLVLLFFFALVFFLCWLVALLFISDRVTQNISIRAAIVFGIGLATMISGSFFFHKLIDSD
jgi:predicted membrane channel-forming protein YqfA (hemolysin III family)